MTEPTGQVIVRPMRPEDVPGAMAVLRQWDMAPTTHEANPERSGIVVENAFVAEDGQAIVGTAGWFAIGDGVAETASMAVDPRYQGLGVGYRLQAARLDAMRRRGFRRVRTEADRPATIRWYIDKFGYRIVGKNPKKHAFSLPDVEEWTVLELDLGGFASA